MSDEYYRQRAARRGRMIWLIVGVALILVCGVVGIVRAYQDSCTGSFERSPEAVINSYINAVANDDLSAVRNCWHYDEFFATETGCSEVCISKFSGTPIEIVEVNFGESQHTDDGRIEMDVNVVILCQENEQEHSAVITLDTVAQNYPWKHWHILFSDLGGTASNLWCQ